MNLNRHFKHAKKLAQHVAQAKMEKLAAAFLKETGLKASEARLCQTTEMGPHGQAIMSFWFDRTDSIADFKNAHPDIKFCFDLLFGFNECAKRGPLTQQDLAAFTEMVSDLMAKYEGHHDAASPLPDQEKALFDIAPPVHDTGTIDKLADGVPR